MSNRWMAAVLVAAFAATAGCRQPAEEKQREEAAKAIEEAARKMDEAARAMEKDGAKGAEQMAQGLEAMARGLGAMAGGEGTAPVEPVGFRELQTAFTVLPGWEMSKPTGERMTSPVSFSKAQVTYRKGDARIEATLIDSGFNQLLMMPYAWIRESGYEKETEDGYEKAITVAGFPGFEKWDGSRRDGELNAFVHKRFILQLEGSNLDDPRVLHQLAQVTELGKLPK